MESVSPYTTRAFHLVLASTIRMAFSKVSLADCIRHTHASLSAARRKGAPNL